MAEGSEEVSNTNINTDTNTGTNTGTSTDTNTNTNTEMPKLLDDMVNAEFVISKGRRINPDDKRYFCADCGENAITQPEMEKDHAGHAVLKAFCRNERYGFSKKHLDDELLKSKGLDVSDIAEYGGYGSNQSLIYQKSTLPNLKLESRDRTSNGLCNTCGRPVGRKFSFCSLSCKVTDSKIDHQLNFANSVEIKNQEKGPIMSDNNQEENGNVNDQEFKKQEEGISISEDVEKAKVPLTKKVIQDMINADFLIRSGARLDDKSYFCFECGELPFMASDKENDHKTHVTIKAVKGGKNYGFLSEKLEKLVSGLDIFDIAEYGSLYGSLVYQKPWPKHPKARKSAKYCKTCKNTLPIVGGSYCSLFCKFNTSDDDQMKVASDMEGKEVSKGSDSHITMPAVITKSDTVVNNQKEGNSDNLQERNTAEGEMTRKSVDDDGDSDGVSDVKKRKTGDSEETDRPLQSEPSC